MAKGIGTITAGGSAAGAQRTSGVTTTNPDRLAEERRRGDTSVTRKILGATVRSEIIEGSVVSVLRLDTGSGTIRVEGRRYPVTGSTGRVFMRDNIRDFTAAIARAHRDGLLSVVTGTDAQGRRRRLVINLGAGERVRGGRGLGIGDLRRVAAQANREALVRQRRLLAARGQPVSGRVSGFTTLISRGRPG